MAYIVWAEQKNWDLFPVGWPHEVCTRPTGASAWSSVKHWSGAWTILLVWSAQTNHAQLVGTEDGTRSTTGRGSSSHICLKSWHHIIFSLPGAAQGKDSFYDEIALNLLRKEHQGWKPRPTDLPSILPPPGLSQERIKYQHDKIREYVPDPFKDKVCPPPITSHPHHTVTLSTKRLKCS